MELSVLNTTLKATVSEEMYLKIVAQLEKDFVMSGIQYDFANLTPDELLISLKEVVEELLSKEYGTFLNLLYRMDIPESAISFTEEEEVENHLVKLFLKREYLKVKSRIEFTEKMKAN